MICLSWILMNSDLNSKAEEQKPEIVNLRKHIEEKLQKMLRRNTTRTKFAERFRNIIDEYYAGGSQNDDFMRSF